MVVRWNKLKNLKEGYATCFCGSVYKSFGVAYDRDEGSQVSYNACPACGTFRVKKIKELKGGVSGKV